MIDETEIATAICCGQVCERESGYCHRHDFINEAHRVRQLLGRKHYEHEFELSLAFQEAGADDSETA